MKNFKLNKFAKELLALNDNIEIYKRKDYLIADSKINNIPKGYDIKPNGDVYYKDKYIGELRIVDINEEDDYTNNDSFEIPDSVLKNGGKTVEEPKEEDYSKESIFIPSSVIADNSSKKSNDERNINIFEALISPSSPINKDIEIVNVEKDDILAKAKEILADWDKIVKTAKEKNIELPRLIDKFGLYKNNEDELENALTYFESYEEKDIEALKEMLSVMNTNYEITKSYYENETIKQIEEDIKKTEQEEEKQEENNIVIPDSIRNTENKEQEDDKNVIVIPDSIRNTENKEQEDDKNVIVIPDSIRNTENKEQENDKNVIVIPDSIRNTENKEVKSEEKQVQQPNPDLLSGSHIQTQRQVAVPSIQDDYWESLNIPVGPAPQSIPRRIYNFFSYQFYCIKNVFKPEPIYVPDCVRVSREQVNNAVNEDIQENNEKIIEKTNTKENVNENKPEIYSKETMEKIILNLQSLYDQVSSKDDRIYFTSVYCDNLINIGDEIDDIIEDFNQNKDIDLIRIKSINSNLKNIKCNLDELIKFGEENPEFFDVDEDNALDFREEYSSKLNDIYNRIFEDKFFDNYGEKWYEVDNEKFKLLSKEFISNIEVMGLIDKEFMSEILKYKNDNKMDELLSDNKEESNKITEKIESPELSAPKTEELLEFIDSKTKEPIIEEKEESVEVKPIIEETKTEEKEQPVIIEIENEEKEQQEFSSLKREEPIIKEKEESVEVKPVIEETKTEEKEQPEIVETENEEAKRESKLARTYTFNSISETIKTVDSFDEELKTSEEELHVIKEAARCLEHIRKSINEFNTDSEIVKTEMIKGIEETIPTIEEFEEYINEKQQEVETKKAEYDSKRDERLAYYTQMANSIEKEIRFEKTKDIDTKKSLCLMSNMSLEEMEEDSQKYIEELNKLKLELLKRKKEELSFYVEQENRMFKAVNGLENERVKQERTELLASSLNNDIETMNSKELKSLAKENYIKGYSKMNKEELIESLNHLNNIKKEYIVKGLKK